MHFLHCWCSVLLAAFFLRVQKKAISLYRSISWVVNQISICSSYILWHLPNFKFLALVPALTLIYLVNSLLLLACPFLELARFPWRLSAEHLWKAMSSHQCCIVYFVFKAVLCFTFYMFYSVLFLVNFLTITFSCFPELAHSPQRLSTLSLRPWKAMSSHQWRTNWVISKPSNWDRSQSRWCVESRYFHKSYSYIVSTWAND